MTNIAEAIKSLTELNAYQLAGMADTHSPDNLESEGAAFLTGVRDAVVEQLEWYNNGDYADAEDASQFVDSVRELDAFQTIPDEAPSIYTHKRFQELVDLCAYQEDISDYLEPSIGGEPVTMETMAGYALYMVAERLVSALLDAVAEYETEGQA